MTYPRHQDAAVIALSQAIATGQDLVVEVWTAPASVITRYAAELFIVREGVGWCDAGWPETSGHPHHLLDGALRETDSPRKWDVGIHRVRWLAEGEPAGATRDSWQAYKARKLAAGRFDDREGAWRAWASFFELGAAARIF